MFSRGAFDTPWERNQFQPTSVAFSLRLLKTLPGWFKSSATGGFFTTEDGGYFHTQGSS